MAPASPILPMLLPPVYDTYDKTGFGHVTAHDRWPVIISNMVEDVETTIGALHDAELRDQGAVVAAQLRQLLADVNADAELTPIEDETVDGIAEYNAVLAALPATDRTWQHGPWLWMECYLYRRAHLYFLAQSKWSGYNVFERVKMDLFRLLVAGVEELAVRLDQLAAQLAEAQPSADQLKVLFRELADISLWGNASDLLLLATATLEDISLLQGAAARAALEKNILANDVEAAWDALINHAHDASARRVDFVLDNAGFELYADCIFLLFLLDSRLVRHVVLHCKTVPWMVSDTMVYDFQLMLDALNLAEFFPSAKREHFELVAARLAAYQRSGQLELQAAPYWTHGSDYWTLLPTDKNGGAAVHAELSKSDLVVVKGDLNYRKLTGDRQWPRDTPFSTGIGPLASAGLKIWALRTCKADVCCGLAPGVDEQVSAQWAAAGNKYGAQWCASGKWAVLSFTSGQ